MYVCNPTINSTDICGCLLGTAFSDFLYDRIMSCCVSVEVQNILTCALFLSSLNVCISLFSSSSSSVTLALQICCFESLLIHNIKDNPQRAQALMKKTLISSQLVFYSVELYSALSSELNEPWWILYVASVGL